MSAKNEMPKENIERRLKHLFDGSDWNVYNNNMLNLGVGAPNTDLLENCCEIFKKATEHRLNYEKRNNDSLLFQYGPTCGIYEARYEIAKYLTHMYKNAVKAEDLYITSGATQGLQLSVTTLIDFNGYIFVDEVTYMIALDLFQQFQTMTVLPVRLNDDGVDLEHLESLLKDKRFTSKTKEFWGIYYTIPTFHNPTGICFSEDVCKGLIKLARRFDVLIICDDVYNLLNYNEDISPKRLFAYDVHEDEDYAGNVISNGSFSKIIASGMRMGWLELPARIKNLIDSCGIVRSGGCLNNYTSGILASLFELGLAQTHINAMYTAYKERMLGTIEILKSGLPGGCKMLPPRGGYFIWIQLPVTVDATDFLKYCLENEKIYFIPGQQFTAANDFAKNYFRISIAFHSKEKLVHAAERLCAVLHQFLSK